ncbi:MAG: hypothetical protein ACI4MT_00020 [Christensenellales bacterium]
MRKLYAFGINVTFFFVVEKLFLLLSIVKGKIGVRRYRCGCY